MTTEARAAGQDGAVRASGRDGSRDVRGASRRFDEALAAARREGRGAPRSAGARALAAADDRRPSAGGRNGARTTATGGSLATALLAPTPWSIAAEGPTPPAAALRAAVRALPAAIEAARLHDGARLHLTLGAALGVDLRGGPAGVEVTLRPTAALAQAAAAELPALVAALRARGVRVARAELASAAGRPPGGAGRQAR